MREAPVRRAVREIQGFLQGEMISTSLPHQLYLTPPNICRNFHVYSIQVIPKVRTPCFPE